MACSSRVRMALLLAAVCLTWGPARAAEPVRAISYNVQFLPSLASIANKRGNTKYRAAELGRKLAVYDIVGLQEVFDDAPRNLLLAGLKQAWGDAYAEAVHPRPADGRFNGGLAIATRLPILAWHATYYTKSSQPKEYGLRADGFAAKGVLHARIARSAERRDEFVDVFITHLEAAADELRPSQYKELAAFIAEHHDPAHPMLVMGDFNTHGNPADQDDATSAYHQVLTDMRGAAPKLRLVDLWPTLHGRELGGTNEQESTEIGNRIDYIFLANPVTAELLRPRAVRVNPFPDEKTKFLSDHSAVEADLEWGR
ncbi:MAG: endonuclease/exonuclease/phosphatase family protein [Pirellulales bacterium]|nr:endonuclease/exonuclease/phosphatase family protein [Pirellulales bacterium]